jgi:hypothetical protein
LSSQSIVCGAVAVANASKIRRTCLLDRPADWHETIFLTHEDVLKQTRDTNDPPTTGAIMVSILNLIYREFLNSAVPGMARLGGRR